MTREETLYAVALSCMPSLSPGTRRKLAGTPGGLATVYAHRHRLRDILPATSDKVAATGRIAEVVKDMDTYLGRAEEEMRQCDTKGISVICLGDERYPKRLAGCDDAPTVLYSMGNADLNARHIVSMIGTRRMTAYGSDFCHRFVEDLARLCPDTLVVSGLAYGVDVCSHRAALEHGLPTVGVLAHGLDQIYPRQHRDTAREMLCHGGLLTEFPLMTAMDKHYFVQRNRIVAGISDATVVVESATKGGSLRTVDFADGYGREVFAVPGRASDTMSAGCNALIRGNKAVMLENAEQFVEAMGWDADIQRHDALRNGVQQELFPTLTPEEELIAEHMSQNEALTVGQLSTATGLPAGKVGAILFDMEMKGAVKSSAGGLFRRSFC